MSPYRYERSERTSQMNMTDKNDEGQNISPLKKDRRNSAIDENIGFGKRRSLDRVKRNELFYGL